METEQALVLQGKVALVTGSTRGIGRALAEGFAAAGAQVWFHGRDQTGGELAAQRCGGRFIRADLSNPLEIRAMVDALSAEAGRLDILVNNAGMEIREPLEELQMPIFDLIWQVKARAAVECTLFFLPLLKIPQPPSTTNAPSTPQH